MRGERPPAAAPHERSGCARDHKKFGLLRLRATTQQEQAPAGPRSTQVPIACCSHAIFPLRYRKKRVYKYTLDCDGMWVDLDNVNGFYIRPVLPQ